MELKYIIAIYLKKGPLSSVRLYTSGTPILRASFLVLGSFGSLPSLLFLSLKQMCKRGGWERKLTINKMILDYSNFIRDL
jgi:hypothetical protein